MTQESFLIISVQPGKMCSFVLRNCSTGISIYNEMRTIVLKEEFENTFQNVTGIISKTITNVGKEGF